MNTPQISVIVPFYGEAYHIKRCLLGLKQQEISTEYEIIIVQSGRTEIKINDAELINCRVIWSQEHLTSGAARNLGVNESHSSLLAFIDADCVPQKDWLSEMYSSLQNYEIVIGPVLNLYPFHPFASVDNLLQFVDFQKRTVKKIDHFPGCSLGIRREVFDAVSGFPELMITGEDVLFSEAAIGNTSSGVFYNRKLIVKHSGRRNFFGFIRHNEVLGFNRGYYNLKLNYKLKPGESVLFYSMVYGLRRLLYIMWRTVQWNPAGIAVLILYLPIVLAGLLYWTAGFYKGIIHSKSRKSSFVEHWERGYK